MRTQKVERREGCWKEGKERKNSHLFRSHPVMSRNVFKFNEIQTEDILKEKKKPRVCKRNQTHA